MDLTNCRPKVLLIAEGANPEWSSVPLVGWSHSQALAEIVDGHLVTQVRNQRAIEAAGLVEGRDFTAIDTENLIRPISKVADFLRGGSGKGWTTVAAIASVTYYYFEQLIWKQFGPRIKAGEFDLVHRLIPLSPTSPSILAARCKRAGVPFVLGPLNGGLPWPKEYDNVRRAEKEWLSYVRRAYTLLPGYTSTRRDAAAIVIGSVATWGQMPAKYHDRCVYIPENAIDPQRFPPPTPRQTTKPIRLVFVGRLVPYKGADVAIEAAASFLRDGTMTLDIVGDGPQRPELERLVEQLGVGASVKLHGMIPHQQVAQVVGGCDLFVFPSIREFGGAVVLEAMAMGTVPMVVDYGGPGELATPQTGFLLDLADRANLVRQVRATLERVAADPSLIDTRREAAARRIQQLFTWQAKARQVKEVYAWALGLRPDKPNFPMPFPDDANVVTEVMAAP